MTHRNGQSRPHCVDLTPGAYISTGNTHNSRASRHYALAAEKHSRAKPTTRFSRSQNGAYTGAVRASASQQATNFQHAGKLSFALLVVAGGILWTTTSIGKSTAPAATAAQPFVQPHALLQTQPLTGHQSQPEFDLRTNAQQGSELPVMEASVSSPAFFFDDTSNALTDHLSSDITAASNAAVVSKIQPTESIESPNNPSETLTVVDEVLFERPEDALPAAKPSSSTVTLAPLVDHPSLKAIRTQTESPDGSTVTTVAVASGNTLSGILNDHGVKIDQMPQLLTDDLVKQHLTNLDIGQELNITQLAEGDFHSLRTRVGDDKRITIQRSANGFAVASIDLPVEKERVVTSGTIEQSLYLAAEQANLKQSTIMELADIFQWELDFAKDIRKGDQFALVYDRLYRDGRYIGDGDILAAEFKRGDKEHRAIRFTTDDGKTAYYSPNGQSMRRTFLRHPVDVVRITSKFNPNRMHPVLHKIAAHRGVDYGSPHGSPIYATADGKFTFSGSKNAYGKTVIIQHGQKLSTLYAHMSRISDKSVVGKRVKQGDVIGYVGKTGRVTGTHLHYEFRVNNKQIDPLKVELPAAAPIEKKYMAELTKISDDMSIQMRSVLKDIDEQVASTGMGVGPLVNNDK